MTESPPSPDPGESGPRSFERVDVSEFIAEEGGEAAADHAAAEGMAPANVEEVGRDSRFGWLRQMVLKTDPDPELGDVEDPWNPEEGGIVRIKRGVMKMADLDGMPAGLDVGIGLFEAIYTFNVEGTRETEETPDAAEGEDPISAQVSGYGGEGPPRE